MFFQKCYSCDEVYRCIFALFVEIKSEKLITFDYNVINMESMQVRIDEKNMNALNELAQTLSSSRSEVIRRVIEGGIRELRMKIAMEKYIDDEFSLCRAAEFSGVSIQQMAKYLAQRGIPFFKQSIEETERDAKEAQSWF